jgi:uncharacterized protein YecE (DUF72 family)
MIRVGPAGWAYKDWARIVYPAKKPRGFSELSYLADFFDAIEINVSFYRPVPAKTTQSWLKHIEANRRFRFTAKLWRGFTHERNASAQDELECKEGLRPLVEAGRLGALLLQFPWSFRNTSENLKYLAELHSLFREFPLVLEVRHTSWNEPGILDFLNEFQMGLCNIDQPLFNRCIAPAAVATSPVGYIRLHGRNYKSWWTENKHAGERYDYLYSVRELDPWIDRIQALSQVTRDTYAITNNHYLGKAIVNASEITSILKGEPVPVPEPLVARYPELLAFSSDPVQKSLYFES